MNLSEAWSRLTPAPLTAATLLGEGAALGDAGGHLLLLDGRGEIHAEVRLPAPVRDLAAVPGGGLLAVLAGEGELFLFEGDRRILHESPGRGLTQVEMGPAGDYVLLVCPEGEGIFLNRYGREMGRMHVAGGLGSVAVVPETGEVVALSPDRTVRGYTPWGKPLWRAELMYAEGRVATDSAGELVLVPSMAYGVEALTAKGRSLGAYDIGEPVKAAACSGDGETLLFCTSQDRLVLLRRDATVLCSEVFPSPVNDLSLSGDGDRALVVTGSGYAHLLRVGEATDAPFLELHESRSDRRRPYLFRRRVFSPFSLLIKPRLDFAPDGSFLAVAGDRKKVQVLDLEGEETAARRYGGSLLDLEVTADRHVRVFATASVFRFDPSEEGSHPEWTGRTDLCRVCRRPGEGVLAMTEDGEILAFPAGEGPVRRLFTLSGPDHADLGAAGDRIVVTRKSGRAEVYDADGNLRGRTDAWGLVPRLLGVSPEGFLLGVGKLLLCLTPDGEEAWRHHFERPFRDGFPVPGAFVITDDEGTVHSVTAGGITRPAFSVGEGRLFPFPPGAPEPGFVLVDGGLLAALRLDGSPRWRFRTPEDITFVRPAPGGRHLGVVAGVELFVFPLCPAPGPEPTPVGRVGYLEFGNG